METGGLILKSAQLEFSKEPRPVYYRELDLLGFDKFWKYEKNDAYPYMWAEANNYFYRGKKVASVHGGACYRRPKIELLDTPESDNKPLQFIDIAAMVEKNRDTIESLAQDTIKQVYNTYVKYKNKVDVFYVAFSGGKDSVVALDIVQRALPHDAFMVLFGDTRMEFPDTYDVVNRVEKECESVGIHFLRAASDLDPEYTWRTFGPPATVLRWCCGVHKTAPQVIALRKYVGKHNFTGMAFIGVRRSESMSRNNYDYVSLGEKHKGQYSCNPIIEWNSAELYMYIFTNNLILNEAYKKGNRRVGCLFCPRASERNEYICRECYREEFDKFANIVRDLYEPNFEDVAKLKEFIEIGGWKARKNGRDLPIKVKYGESAGIIKVENPKVNWKIWINTIGILLNDKSPYRVLFQDQEFSFEIITTVTGYEVHYDEAYAKICPAFVKLFKNVFRRAACCIGCQECEADCHNGCIKMHGMKVEISEQCLHCAQCHNVDKGCLIYKSLHTPKGCGLMIRNKSLNCYSHHAPKMDWFIQYFKYKDDFAKKNSLGSQMYDFFKRFLRDAGLLDKKGFSETAKVIGHIGLDNLVSWAIMLVNLSYTPQINWFIKRIKMQENYGKEYAISLMVQDGAKESWVKDVWTSFGRLLELPFNEVGMGHGTKERNRLVSLTRTPWRNPDPRVILYSLYKFAEACDGYYQFTLTRLLDHDIDSSGVSPTEIFGIDRDTMEKILGGLSINYPEFINASFTLDLDNITLNSEKASSDVLTLF